jgi:hypothetical protein
MQRRRIFASLGGASAAGLLCLATIAQAQPSADQILADSGLAAGDKQRVLDGEFVTVDIPAVSARDVPISIGMAFAVKTSPDALSKQIVAGELIRADPEVRAHGQLSSPGSLADLAGLQITSDAAQALSSAQAGKTLNLGAGDIAAFGALRGGTQQAVQQQLRRMLLARYQAYRAGGLAGIVPYDRGGGSTTDVAEDLRKASQAARVLRKYLPAFHAVLLGFPQATIPEMRQSFYWVNAIMDGKPTYVLTHILAASDGAARAVVARQYYVSASYNAAQVVAGFLPVQDGTVVALAGHTFTEQVAGFGGSLKRRFGQSIMADKLKRLFEAGRRRIGQ